MWHFEHLFTTENLGWSKIAILGHVRPYYEIWTKMCFCRPSPLRERDNPDSDQPKVAEHPPALHDVILFGEGKRGLWPGVLRGR